MNYKNGKKILLSPWFIICASAIAVILINWSDFYTYWASPFIQGWDSQGHASVGEYYSDHIFPNTWGWISNWYAGMPFPQFYPPLFYFIMALLHHVIPFISYLTLFKIFVTLMQSSLPAVLIWFVYKRNKSHQALWMTAIFSVALTSSYFNLFTTYGMNVLSTLHTGMFAQLLGFILLILWLHYFLQIEHSVKARYISGVLLFLSFLSNVHNDAVILIIFLCIFSYSFVPVLIQTYNNKDLLEKKNLTRMFGIFFIYFFCGGLPLLATAFWTVPLIYTYTYFVTIPILTGSTIFTLVKYVWILPLVILVSLLVNRKTKERDSTVIGMSLIMITAAIYLIPDNNHLLIPTHTSRWFGVVIFMLPILCGLIYDRMISMLGRVIKHKSLLFVLICIIIFVGCGSYTITDFSGYYLNYNKKDYSNLISYIKSHTNSLGITAVESAEITDTSALFVYDSIFGQYGAGASTFVLRESSVNSEFMTPIRNSLSQESEGWGIRSYLMFDDKFLQQNASTSIDRAEMVGIQSFFVRSKYAKDRLTKDPRIILIASFGNWELFSFKSTTTRAEILSSQPVEFYGDLTFKERWINDYDWNRIQEELLFWDKKDIKFVYAPDQNINTSSDLYSASTTIVTSYKYTDETAAIKKLLTYSRTNKLILVAQYDPIFTKLEKLYMLASTTKKYNIEIVDHLGANIVEDNPLRKQLGKLFTELELKQPLVVTNDIKVTGTDISDSKIRVNLSGTSTTPIPVLIKISYFPAWQRPDNQPLYLTSPAFTLTYATSSFDIDFTTPNYVKIGWMISLLTIPLSIGLYYLNTRRKKD